MACDPKTVQPLTTRQVAQIAPVPQQRRWLIDELWLACGVGILGGQPKVCKTYLAAQLSVAVASGGTVFGRAAPSPGPVLFFGAEDSLAALRERFEGLAAVHDLALDDLPIYLIDAPVLRIDRDHVLTRLRATIETLAPRLLVLDPFVRMARVDENSAADVSAVLASLRAIQRDYELAILLVHHARKSPAAHPNQALRGSSDFAAWSYSNLYLMRRHQRLMLFVEHRSAPSPERPLSLRLRPTPAPHLALSDHLSQPAPPAGLLHQAILDHLTRSPTPLSTTQLRELLRKRKADVVDALRDLRASEHIDRCADGWLLKPRD
jgi:hypothetical protein